MILDQLRSAVDFATHLPRYHEIIQVIFKYGLAEELRLAALQHFLKIEMVASPASGSDLASKPLPVRVRLALEELGPTFIKFGQILSSRRDLVTDDFYYELCKLQSNVPPFPADEARKILHQELGKPVSQLFREFDDVPLGSASMAQVHRAVLFDDTLVAIKIQRPDIEKVINLDLDILVDFARLLERHVPEFAVLNPVGVVSEFADTLRHELDFTNEARNTDRFGKLFEGNADIKVPRVFGDYTTKRILTMEYVVGLPVEDTARLQKAGIDPIELAERMTKLIYEMIFQNGFFHADPHPGNMAILPGGVIALYDYGMMGNFTQAFRSSLAHLVAGLAEKDHQQVMRSILDMSEEGYTTNSVGMLHDVETFSDQHLNQPLKDINLGNVLNRLLELLRKNHLRMKGAFYLGVKAITQVEAIGRALNPDLNFIMMGRPYAMDLLEEKFRPGRLWNLVRRLVSDSIDLLEDFPQDFRTLYQRLKHGRFSFPLEHKIDPEGFEPLRKTLDSIANRLTNAILAASVLICSSILILANIPPHIFNIPLIGFIGLVFGAYMCIRLVLSIWRHGGL